MAEVRVSTPIEQPKTSLAFHRRQEILSYALLLPAVVATLALIVWPLYQVVDLSFRDGQIMNFARVRELPLGLGNYQRVLSDSQFWQSALTSAIYVGASVALAWLVGLGTALLLDERLPGNRFLRTMILVPWAVPGVIVGIMFLWILDASFGVFNAVLRDLGVISTDIAWYVHSDTALLSVILPTVWKSYPLITLTILAALQSIPKELYEAAEMDGGTRWQRFRYVTWPGIRAASLLVAMIAALGIFRDVDIVFATTGGGPAHATETLALYVYREAFDYFRLGAAAAAGTIMVVVALAVGLTMSVLAARSRM